MPRAAIMAAPGAPIEVRELPSPKLLEGSVLLETVYSEVCGTDVHLYRGRLDGVPYPIVPGHVSVGRVVEIRGSASDIEGAPIVPGAVVTFHDVHETCHACWYCEVARAPNRCAKRKVYGITYPASDPFLGGWGEVIHLKPGVKILPVPATIPPERVIAAGCGLATALHAVDRADIQIGDAVVVQGSGPVGIATAVLARRSGADTVIVIGDPEHRLRAVLALGADETLSVSGVPPRERRDRVRSWTGGRGADVVVEATGVPNAIREGFDLVRDGGRVVIAGHYTDAGEVSINPHTHINRKHLEIRGAWGADFNHFHRMMRVLARWREIDWEQLISRRYGLGDMNTALADVEAGRVVKAVVEP